jgi:diguanylate cyclase
MSAAQIAKATLHRLAQSRLEPTPENYLRAWIEAGGSAHSPDAEGAAWAALFEQLVRGLERGGRQWTPARRKDGLQRLFDAGRNHPQRLRERLSQLVASWQQDEPEAPSQPAAAAAASVPAAGAWGEIADSLCGAVRSGLPAGDAPSATIDDVLAGQAARWARAGADETLAQEVKRTCTEVQRSFAQRHSLVDELGRLVRSLTEGLTELAEDESWAKGQADAMRARLDGEGALSVRGVRSAAELLAQTRIQQQRLRGERDRARAALKALVDGLASELESLGSHTGRFGEALQRSTESLERADSPEQLTVVLQQVLAASRSVQGEVADASARLASGRAQAESLNARVRELEADLRRLSEEVSTDALTQVANRRGLAQAFEVESARSLRDGSPLAVGLIDIDNFKKLNDTLGHAAGDEALKTLASQVRAALRPTDHVARFGGEEFVVLLPGLALEEGRETLTRVQRGLSMGLFMHEGREVFVTFSAGITSWRAGEGLDPAIERADGALYEAKRTGKNRTCIA